jgi:hypothetical protein
MEADSHGVGPDLQGCARGRLRQQRDDTSIGYQALLISSSATTLCTVEFEENNKENY